MSKLIIVFLLQAFPLSATYIFWLDKTHESREFFEFALKNEPPRSFDEPDFESVPHAWIPPSLWQLGALHAFFSDSEVRRAILAFSKKPLEYEQTIHTRLSTAHSLEEIVEGFDERTQSVEGLADLFFLINRAVCTLYDRATGSEAAMLHLAISELPLFDQWPEMQFPFWNSPWIYNPQSAQIFYEALQDEDLLAEILNIERMAHENGEWVLYRGYAGLGFPSSLEIEHACSHALSFGSTLLGGVFFSLEATALTYAKPAEPMKHSFLALRVTPEKMKELFCVGPLHPFVQLLADGELFHAHTKIATLGQSQVEPLNGYFMQSNKYCFDPVGYLLNPRLTPEELQNTFLQLCRTSGHLF